MATVGLMGHVAALPITAANAAVGPIARQDEAVPPLMPEEPVEPPSPEEPAPDNSNLFVSLGYAAARRIASISVQESGIVRQVSEGGPPPPMPGGPDNPEMPVARPVSDHLAFAPVLPVTSPYAQAPFLLSRSQAAALPPVREEAIIVPAPESAYGGYGDKEDVVPFRSNLLVPAPENVHDPYGGYGGYGG